MAEITLRVRVAPRCKKEGVFLQRGEVSVRVSEVPEKGKANDAVISLLAVTFGIPKRDVVIVSGHTSKYKMVRLPEEILPLLKKLKVS